MNANDERQARYRVVFSHTYADVLAFVQRRSDPHRAEDIVADAMLVAWRRIDELPRELPDARAWIFGIARNCLLNDDRSRRRQAALAVRLAGAGSPALAAQTTGSHPTGHPIGHPTDRVTDPVSERVSDRVDLARAWAGLTASEQEVLALVALDGLDSTRAGAVLGISATAYRLRLSRARRALRRRLEGVATGGAPEHEEVHS